MNVTPKDRELIDRLIAAIATSTDPDEREDLRDHLAGLTHSYVIANILEDDDDTPNEAPPVSHAEP